MLFFDAGSLEWLPCESLQPCVLRSGLLVRFSWQSRQAVESQPAERPSSKSPSSQAAAKAERTRGALLPKPPDWGKSLGNHGSIPIHTIFRGLFTSINPSYFDVNRRGTRWNPPFFASIKWTNGFLFDVSMGFLRPFTWTNSIKDHWNWTAWRWPVRDHQPKPVASTALQTCLSCPHSIFEGAKLEPFKTSYFSETMLKYRELMIVGCCSSRFFETFCDYPQLWIWYCIPTICTGPSRSPAASPGDLPSIRADSSSYLADPWAVGSAGKSSINGGL